MEGRGPCLIFVEVKRKELIDIDIDFILLRTGEIEDHLSSPTGRVKSLVGTW